MSFKIVNEDITKMVVDAIVNAANTGLKMGGGVCGAIFRAAGADELTKSCYDLAPIDTGEAVITDGFNLKAKYIIHTAGPVYNPNNDEESARLLEKSYKNSLILARENDVSSLAFPLISAGIYGFPKIKAFEIAKETIENFLKENDMDVYLTIVDKEIIDRINNGTYR